MNSGSIDGLTAGEQDQFLEEAIHRDEPRLRRFIRRHVRDTGDVEDILQDVLYELVEAYRLMKPIEHVTGWLFRVARNRIVDLFRGRKADSLSDPIAGEDEDLVLEDLLPSSGDGPEAAYARSVLIDALEEALDELPVEQREVFVAHEVAGTSFKELAEQTGVSINTLLSRKRYAILYLRVRLQEIHNDFKF
jgi:RNA polymerase sigma factor (sigma-70 family)